MRALTAPPRARGGFTLVELMIAIIMITVGVLALAGGSAAVLRQMQLGAQQSTAAAVAQSRFETLRGTQCSSLASGSQTSSNMTETWTVAFYRNSTYQVTEVVTYKNRKGVTKTVTMTTLIPCVS